MLRDIAWRDDESLLLVVVDGGGVVVYEVAAGELAQAQSHLCGTIAREGPSPTKRPGKVGERAGVLAMDP